MFYSKKEQQYGRTYILIIAIVLFFLVFVLKVVHADNSSSSNFQIENGTLNLGGGLSSSSSFQLISSIGELGIGESLSTGFTGHIGFLYFPEELVVPSPPDDGGGGGGGGLEYLPILPLGECKYADFNCDGLVNIEDLSILLYYFDKSSSLQRSYDLSKDGLLDIRDISIMFYYWDF